MMGKVIKKSCEIQVAKLVLNEGTGDEENGQMLKVDFSKLKQILLPFMDKKIAVLNIAGDFRTGKSFLMSLLLHNLEHNEEGDWLLLDGLDLGNGGFSFRAGSDRHTDGIMFWSKPFLLKQANGEDLVLLLADTQGLSDNETDDQGDRLIFAFSTLMASAQILNIKRQLTSSNIEMLDYFIKFAQTVTQGNDGKQGQNADNRIFQDLLVLIRNWPSPGTHPFGFVGGEQYFRKFTEDEEVSEEICLHRDAIKATFTRNATFLLPHPGDAVEKANFKISELDQKFVDQIRQFALHLFGPNGVGPKILHGQMLTCHQWLEAMEFYGRIFSENKNLPPAKTMLQAADEINYRLAANASLTLYVQEMEKVCKCALSDDQLEYAHAHFFASSIELFNNAKKLDAGPNMEQKFRSKLEQQLLDHFERFEEKNAKLREQNEAKAKHDCEKQKGRKNMENAEAESRRANEETKKRQEKMADGRKNENDFLEMKNILEKMKQNENANEERAGKMEEEMREMHRAQLERGWKEQDELKEKIVNIERKREEDQRESSRHIEQLYRELNEAYSSNNQGGCAVM